MSSLTKYNLGLLDVVDDEKKLLNFLRMEKWLADRPHHPGEAAKQWLKDLYQQNKLVKNQFELGGRKVELANITMPVLNVYAKEDHIIPPQCSRALAECVGTDDYSEIGLAGGHVGVFVSGKSQGILGKGLSIGSRSDREPIPSVLCAHDLDRHRGRDHENPRDMQSEALLSPRFGEFIALGPHGFTQMGYTAWGPEDAERTVVCVHGLTRNSRDFDFLAQRFAALGMRVVAPDLPGRGRSAPVEHAEDYGTPLYLAVLGALIAHLGVNADRLGWHLSGRSHRHGAGRTAGKPNPSFGAQ